MKPLVLWTGAVAMLLARTGSGQCSIATSFAGGNSQRGNMFDVVATQPLQVTGFDLNLTPGLHNLVLYTKAGTWVGHENDAGSWTQVGQAPNVNCTGSGAATNLPISCSIPIAVGARQAFFIVTTGPPSGAQVSPALVYTNGTAVGNVAIQDQNVRIFEGAGLPAFGSSVYAPRIWNGRMRYLTGTPEYQVNQAGAALAVNNVQGTACSKASTTIPVCTAIGAAATFEISMSAATNGAPFDLVLTSGPAMPASGGAYVSQHGQVLNLNLADPTLTALLGLAGSVPFSDATIPVIATAPISVTFQLVVLDGTSPDGGWLSQVNELHVVDTLPPSALPGPSDDDGYETYSFSKIPFGPTSFPFYNSSYSSFSVVSNGRVMFGGVDTGYLPAASLAATQAPSIDAWADLDPSAGGSIGIWLQTPGVVRIQWTGVPYWGTPSSANTFAITLDAAQGSVTIDGLQSFPPLVVAPMLLGISPGSPIATNPGLTTFSVGGPHPAPAGAGMTYQFGPVGTLAGGCSSIVFVPNGSGNYIWTAY